MVLTPHMCQWQTLLIRLCQHALQSSDTDLHGSPQQMCFRESTLRLGQILGRLGLNKQLRRSFRLFRCQHITSLCACARLYCNFSCDYKLTLITGYLTACHPGVSCFQSDACSCCRCCRILDPILPDCLTSCSACA